MNYWDRLRHVREERNLTQEEVGNLINKSQQGYNHIETGRIKMGIDDLATLCKFYNISADYLIGLTDKEKKLDNES
ncbi:MAG: helix-turn-helix transcriptional regulator [Clostridiales bacterium]|nr:helix-turn-helix transcriptional regulator [Clostridiales bacterium]